MAKRHPAQMAFADDHNRSVRMAPKTAQKAEEIAWKAHKRGMRVMGHRAPVAVRASHVLRMAIELGLPKVMAELERLQSTLEAEDSEA